MKARMNWLAIGHTKNSKDGEVIKIAAGLLIMNPDREQQQIIWQCLKQTLIHNMRLETVS